ncbi:hypothetical protein TrST_g5093 [Triparma strigata]|uniref:CW-type domain-containing protein n=1 Tax=Triparma strigata TaxID=1606541 RepID=A0A9W7B314_9STRA|nr:hypothetical protein TrST_g5093 [Triparma strigata]
MVYVSKKKTSTTASSANESDASSRTITPSPRVSGRGRQSKVPSRFVEAQDDDDDEISRKRERKKANDAASKRKREQAKQQEDQEPKRPKHKPNGYRSVPHSTYSYTPTLVAPPPPLPPPPPLYYDPEPSFAENARLAEEKSKILMDDRYSVANSVVEEAGPSTPKKEKNGGEGGDEQMDVDDGEESDVSTASVDSYDFVIPKGGSEQNVRKHLRLWVRRLKSTSKALDVRDTSTQRSTRLKTEKAEIEGRGQPYTWIKCDNPNCGKWRALAKGMEIKDIMTPKPFYYKNRPDKWYCVQNWWDEKLSSCTAPQECLPDEVFSSKGRAFINNKAYTASEPENEMFPGMVLPFFCNTDENNV